MSTNLYKENAYDYIKAGYSATPAKYKTKLPAIKNWTRYCTQLPTDNEFAQWANTFQSSNIDICLGEASGIIALDFDSTDPKIIDLIGDMMPSSPVERRGAKGWVRFFRYSGEVSHAVKHNGEIVFEILSDNKKVTIPPSEHPSGLTYSWRDKSLLDIKKEDLPLLPFGLVPEVQNKLMFLLPGTNALSPVKTINGRNDSLSSECGKIIEKGKPLDEALKHLIKFDKEHHENPLFEDVAEWGHNEPFTAALTFYSNHLRSINAKRFQKHQEYEIPITASAVNDTYVEEVLKKKEQNKEDQKNASLIDSDFNPPGVLGAIYNHILDNSYVPQPLFALSASLSLMSTLIGRKTVFNNVAPNLYLLNIASSGSGKNIPMQAVKNIFSEINAFYLLGAGDYVSDASLMDELTLNPVRLDIVDEASGLLKGVTAGGNSYNGKMADILCELYTSSNERFLGRMTAEGRKGLCDRPNVNLLCSTTPSGFSESVSKRAIEKGLLGRFLIFRGENNKPARRLEKTIEISENIKETLLYWKNFQPAIKEGFMLGDITQRVFNVEASPQASKKLDEIFREFDNDRCSQKEDSSLLPILARLYEQLLKICLISACSRCKSGMPQVDLVDVDFAYKVISFFRNEIKDIIFNNIFSNDVEAKYVKVLNIIKKYQDGISQPEFNELTRWLKPKERDMLIRELVNDRKIIVHRRDDKNISDLIYLSTEG